jgi:hypothetical protein
MTSFIAHTTVDCRNAYELSEWWKRVLGYVDLEDEPNGPGHEECLIVSPESGHRLLFVNVPDEKVGKNRLHFGIQPRVGTRDEEVRRVVALGAKRSLTNAITTALGSAGWSCGIRRQRVLHSAQRRGAGGGPDAAAALSCGCPAVGAKTHLRSAGPFTPYAAHGRDRTAAQRR